jgi:hypothetical protein
MNMPLREFRLSSKPGQGVRCDTDGAFVGAVPLLDRNGDKWESRHGVELSKALSRVYGLPVDVTPKRGGLSVIAKALNDGDVARAQIGALFLHLPDPLPLKKGAPNQSEIIDLALALDCAGILKINTRHYPAKAPGGKGGQFAPKDADTDQSDSDIPDAPNNSGDVPNNAAERRAERRAATAATETAEQAAERRASDTAVRNAVEEAAVSAEKAELRIAARRAFREAALDALKNAGKKLVLSEIPIVGQLADLATLYDVYRFAKQFIELRAAIKAATRFINEGAHTLANLRVSQQFARFDNYDALVKTGCCSLAGDDLEKRFGAAGDGMEYHHIIERTSGASKAVTETTENIIRIPAILHEAINGEYQKTFEWTKGLSLRDWLRRQPDDVKKEYGLWVLHKLGIIAD